MHGSHGNDYSKASGIRFSRIRIDLKPQTFMILKMKIFFTLYAISILMCLFGCAGVGGSISYPVNGKVITLSVDDKTVKAPDGNK